MSDPATGGRGRTLLYVSAAVLVVGELFQFLVYRNHVRFTGGSDFLMYASHSEEILSGLAPGMIWKPFGAGAWLAGYRGLFGDNMAGFAVFDSVALGMLPLFAFGFGFFLRGMWAGIAAAALVTISPACATQSILAETPATFFLALSLLSLAGFQKTARNWLAGLGAVFLAAAWLCRPDSFVYAVPALALAIRPGRGFARFAGVITFGSVTALLLFAVCLYNRPSYGRALPVRYDAYLRYILVFDTGKDYRIDAGDPSIQEIRRSLIESGAADENDLDDTNFLSWNRGWVVVRKSLNSTTGSYYEADRIMSGATTGVIRRNLGAFAEGAARMFASFVVFRPALGAYTFAHFESKPDYPWRRFDSQRVGDERVREVADRLYGGIRQAREDRPYNNWTNPYNARYLQFLSLAPLVIYPSVFVLLLMVRGLARWQMSAVLAGSLLAFAAYATGGFFDYRYLSSHSWALWGLAGLGLAAAAEHLVSRRYSKRTAASQDVIREPSIP